MTGPLAPVLTMIETGQARQFAYLHAAVYAGNTMETTMSSKMGDPFVDPKALE